MKTAKQKKQPSARRNMYVVESIGTATKSESPILPKGITQAKAQHADAIHRSTVQSYDGKANEDEARVLMIVEWVQTFIGWTKVGEENADRRAARCLSKFLISKQLDLTPPPSILLNTVAAPAPNENRDGGFDIYADLKNAGPRHSSALGGNNDGYQPLPPSTPKPKEDSGSTIGPPWQCSELREMTKAGKRERKHESRQGKRVAWKRGERGMRGKGFTKRMSPFRRERDFRAFSTHLSTACFVNVHAR
ncbi:hypothetical protein ARMGADRAFT_1029376 [Armillaria gallica]|uniref:Uncharacterized protein n=1 Tax=Armillaria gallica TaxID=47427 RepID=A0A2H3DG65_ARMGA|nr:hypothetical protein ARMGADRAFT_1029376 [Armillaria gallica]